MTLAKTQRAQRKPEKKVPSSQFSVVRPFVASENGDRHLFLLGWSKSSQSLTSNVARTVGSLVRKAVRGDQGGGKTGNRNTPRFQFQVVLEVLKETGKQMGFAGQVSIDDELTSIYQCHIMALLW